MDLVDAEEKPASETLEFVSDTPLPAEVLKLDPHGYPLRPQPSTDPLGQGKTEENLTDHLRPELTNKISFNRSLELAATDKARRIAAGFLPRVIGTFCAGLYCKLSTWSLCSLYDLTATEEFCVHSPLQSHGCHCNTSLIQYHHCHRVGGRRSFGIRASVKNVWSSTRVPPEYRGWHGRQCRLCSCFVMGTVARIACPRRYWNINEYGHRC